MGGKNRAPLSAPDVGNPRAPRLTLKGCEACEEKEVEWRKSCITLRLSRNGVRGRQSFCATATCEYWCRISSTHSTANSVLHLPLGAGDEVLCDNISEDGCIFLGKHPVLQEMNTYVCVCLCIDVDISRCWPHFVCRDADGWEEHLRCRVALFLNFYFFGGKCNRGTRGTLSSV